MNEVNLDFVDRYVALWNESDPEVRRQTIVDLWAPSGDNYTQSMQAVGYDALEARVTSAYDAYVGSGTYTFRSDLPPVGHHGVVKVTWVTVPAEEIASIGIEFLVLDDQGRIASDHQFIVQWLDGMERARCWIQGESPHRTWHYQELTAASASEKRLGAACRTRRRS